MSSSEPSQSDISIKLNPKRFLSSHCNKWSTVWVCPGGWRKERSVMRPLCTNISRIQSLHHIIHWKMILSTNNQPLWPFNWPMKPHASRDSWCWSRIIRSSPVRATSQDIEDTSLCHGVSSSQIWDLVTCDGVTGCRVWHTVTVSHTDSPGPPTSHCSSLTWQKLLGRA